VRTEKQPKNNNQQIGFVKNKCAILRDQVEQAKLQAEETQLGMTRIKSLLIQ